MKIYWPETMKMIGEATLIQTCSACPEQYDVFKGDVQIGYLRMRWGRFTAEYPDCGGLVVFEHDFGDGISGILPPNERSIFLEMAVGKLLERERELHGKYDRPEEKD